MPKALRSYPRIQKQAINHQQILLRYKQCQYAPRGWRNPSYFQSSKALPCDLHFQKQGKGRLAKRLRTKHCLCVL
jgi:hypothetical protein